MQEENGADNNKEKVDFDPTRIDLGKEDIKHIPKSLFQFKNHFNKGGSKP